jgi:hypothetical protein
MPHDTVHWNNQNWDSITLEIRRGNASAPTDNPVVAEPTLARNDAHTETSEAEDFWYVRTDPPSDGVYIHRPCYGNGSTYDENL